jgi:hypothetical protein
MINNQLLVLIYLLGTTLTGCNLLSQTNTTFTPLSASSVTATVQGTKQVQLTWGLSPGSPTGYQVEQSLDGTTFSQVQQLGLVTTTKVTGLASGRTYYFRVRSYNQGGESPYSQIIPVITTN